MGIGRDSRHKRRSTGGKRKIHVKKRKFELGRPPASTRIAPGDTRIRRVRCMGGNYKFRALRLDSGDFSWASKGIARKTRVLVVVYNATSNELVRTNTLVKSCIVQVDATPFKQWYEQRFGIVLGKKSKDDEEKKPSKSQQKRHEKRIAAGESEIDPALADQFITGRLYAKICSRPGQSGRADGVILEGEELAYYVKKIETKKK